ncbi:hypothetical protein, partial [Salmonella enterica]|uniref:hypothetical protein n=1 Tax=Salmonella enterica TaxID=28901 RepID=UPI001C60E89B
MDISRKLPIFLSFCFATKETVSLSAPFEAYYQCKPPITADIFYKSRLKQRVLLSAQSAFGNACA